MFVRSGGRIDLPRSARRRSPCGVAAAAAAAAAALSGTRRALEMRNRARAAPRRNCRHRVITSPPARPARIQSRLQRQTITGCTFVTIRTAAYSYRVR